MLIFVEYLGKRHELNVENNDTMETVKSRVENLVDIPSRQQHLIYAGKQLEDSWTLSVIGIKEGSILALVLRRRSPAEDSTVPIELVHPDEPGARASIQLWKNKAERGGFDDDICIVDPQAHYTHLSGLERDAVMGSEFVACKGTYTNAFDNKISELAQRHGGLSLVSGSILGYIDELNGGVAQIDMAELPTGAGHIDMVEYFARAGQMDMAKLFADAGQMNMAELSVGAGQMDMAELSVVAGQMDMAERPVAVAQMHMAELLAGVGQMHPTDIAERLRSIEKPLNSLWTSYLILCRVLASFDLLSKASFCTSYYSILLEQPERKVAEIVKISRDTLDNIKSGIEVATAHICRHNSHPAMMHQDLLECIAAPCSQFLKALHLSTFDLSRSTTTILTLCRSLSLLADVGLVSYVGSHVARFDEEYLHTEIPIITVGNGDSDSDTLHFDCQPRSLACLSDFLDKKQVWVFRCGLGELMPLPLEDDPHSGLFVLTHIEEFADIWGPVWSVPAHRGFSEPVRQHNVSKGVICRVDEAAGRPGSPVRCHWYSWTSFQMRRANRLLTLAKKLYLEKDDLLLIGTRSRDNGYCKYTLDQFEMDYGHEMNILGGEHAFWESDLDSRTAGLSLGKYLGFTVSGTQKRRPQTSLKQLILAKWKTAPQTANPGILNQYLGVEISHCTGNARRVSVKDLLLMSTVQPLLELHFPEWSNLSWGKAFLEALQSSNPEAVFDVWSQHHANRSEMASIVCYVLEILDKTGRSADGLTAALLNNRRESSITFDNHCNDWSNLLRDSHLMATYAIISDACIECHTPDHSTATCNGEAAYTVFRTQLGLRSLQEHPKLVKVEPYAQLCKTLEKLDPETLRMMPLSGAAAAQANPFQRPAVRGIEIRDGSAGIGSRYKVFLRASHKSYSGMKTARNRVKATQAIQAHCDTPNRALIYDRNLYEATQNINPPVETTLTPPQFVSMADMNIPAVPDQ